MRIKNRLIFILILNLLIISFAFGLSKQEQNYLNTSLKETNVLFQNNLNLFNNARYNFNIALNSYAPRIVYILNKNKKSTIIFYAKTDNKSI